MKNCGRMVLFIVMLALLSGILNGCILKKKLLTTIFWTETG